MCANRINPMGSGSLLKLPSNELSAALYNSMFRFLKAIYPISRELEDEITSRSAIVKFKKGDIILKHGHVCRYCYFAGCGLVRGYYITESGEDISSWFMKEGDIFIAVQSFFEQLPSREAIEALEDTACVRLPYETLEHLYREFPEFNFNGRKLTERYYIQMQERAFSLRMDSAEEKYSKLEEHQPEILARVPLKDIASYIGIAPGTLSRIRNGRRISSHL